MLGLVPEILDALCLVGAAAWPVLGLAAGLEPVKGRVREEAE